MGTASIWWAGCGIAAALLGIILYQSVRNVRGLQKSSFVGDGRSRWVLTGFTILSAAAAATYFSLLTWSIRRAVTADRKPTRENPNPERLRDDLNLITTYLSATVIPFCLAGILASSFAMWRCIHIWTASRGFCYLAMFLYVAGVGSGLAASSSSLSSNELAEVNRFYSYLAFLFSLFFFYLLITIAIVSKSIRYLKEAPPETREKLTVAGMLLESFIVNTIQLPCIGALTIAGVHIWPSDDHWRPLGILVPVFFMTQFIHTSLIVSRVAGGTAFGPKSFKATNTIPLTTSDTTLTER